MKKELKFKGKKVLIFGLGILGGGVEAAKWFYKNGAKIIITDKKTKKELLPSIKRLKKIKAKYILGKHRFEDIDSSDIIYFNPGVSYKSEWVQYAKEKGKEVVNDCYIFFKYAKGDIIAITGTRGKTTTTTWIYELLTQVSNIYPNNRPNKLPESSDRIKSTRITRPNNIYPNKEPNNLPEYQSNKDQRFGPNSGNPFGPHSGSDLKFGQHSGNIFGQNSGRNILLGGNQPERSLFKILDKTKEDTISVLEISSFQLEFYSNADLRRLDADSRRLSNIKAPKIAIITNIYNDHLNRYSSFEEYASVKARIFQNQTEEDYLILNLDNKWTDFFLRLKPKSQVYFVSLHGPPQTKRRQFGQVKVRGGIYIKDEKIFIEDKDNACLRKSALSLPASAFRKIYGEHNLYNLLFALLAVYLYLKSKNIKNPQDKIKKLKNFILNLKTPEFRQEIIYKNKNLMIVNDSAATSPDATINAIERFKKYICPKSPCLAGRQAREVRKSLRNLILITGGTDKNLDFKDLAKKIKKEIKPENLILLNGSATKKLIEELKKLNYPLIEENIFEDLREAVIKALKLDNSSKIYPNDRPNKLSESSDRIDSTRITRPNNNYPNKRPNGNETFVQNSGNTFGPHSGSDIKFGHNSGKVFGQDSGNSSVVLFSPASASFEKFKNEFDRGKKFNRIIKAMLKLLYGRDKK